MNVDDLFKVPAVPIGKNKRKAPLSDADIVSKYRQISSEGGASGAASTRVPSNGFSTHVQNVDEDEEYENHTTHEEDEDSRFYGSGLTQEQNEILEYVDENEADEYVFDDKSVRAMLLSLEKAITKNSELRMKYASEPSRFMESEADLDEAIKALHTLTQVPHLYPELVRLGSIQTLLGLLSHENTDIMIDVADLINEMTDEDVGVDEGEEDEVEAANEGIKSFVDALVEGQALELLVQNLARLDENEAADQQGVFKILGIFENLTSFSPELVPQIVQTTELMPWLLERCPRKGPFDSNKGYAGELLAILLQNNSQNRKKLAQLGGIDTVLRVLSTYRKRDPQDDDETEHMENMFDILCSCLNEPEIKRIFHDAEGIELMVLMMKQDGREKLASRTRAPKVLNYSMSGPQGTINCIRFVDALGLKTLFAAFMGKGTKRLVKDYPSFSPVEEQEHLACILVSLFNHLPANQVHRHRLLLKFTENNYEKTERLVELRLQVAARVARANQQEEQEEEDEEEAYLRRLDAGLFTLQMLDMAVAWLCKEDPKAKERMAMLLSRQSASFDDVKAILEEYVDNLGDDTDEQDKDQGEDTKYQRGRILTLMNSL